MLGIYARTSNIKLNKNDFSIKDQINAGIVLAKKLNLDFEIFEDKGISGTNADRPALMELMHAIKTKKITHVYAYDQSRIERSMDIWSFFSGVCISYNIEVYLGSNKIELNDPTSMLVANMMSLFNNFYAKITSQKVKTANRSKAAKGKTHGILPYGIGSDDNNNFIEIPEESKIVREIFNLSKSGIGAWKISDILNKKGYKTSREIGKWSGTTVESILKNTIYKGIRIFDKNNKKDGAIQFELPFKIIDPILFDEVQILRSSNKIPVGPKNKYDYLLTDKIICGHCGGLVKGIHKPTGNLSVYRCKNHNKQAQNYCTDSGSINITDLDNLIFNLIFSNSVVEDYLQYFHNDKELKNKLEDEILHMKKDLKNLNTKKTKILNLIEFSDSNSNDTELNSRFTKLSDEITKIEIELKNREIELIKINKINPITTIIENRKINFKLLNKSDLKKICSDSIEYIKTIFDNNKNIIILIKLKYIDQELAYFHKLRTNKFTFLIPKDKNNKTNLISELAESNLKSSISVARHDSYFQDLNVSNSDYEANEDYFDDLSLEYEVLTDEESLHQKVDVENFNTQIFDYEFDRNNLFTFVGKIN